MKRLRTPSAVLVCLALLTACMCVTASKPPHYGVFIKQGNSLVEMEQGAGGPPDDTGIPRISDRQPTIVFWEPNIDLGLLVLAEEVGGVGVSWDRYATQPIIGGVVSGSPAERAGLLAGDLVVRVDNVGVSTVSEAMQRMRGPVDKSVTVTVQRPPQNQVLTVEITRVPIDVAGQTVKFDVTPKEDGMLEIRPRSPLSPGMYCFGAGSFIAPASMIPHWCFVVK